MTNPRPVPSSTVPQGPKTGALSPDWIEVLYEITRQFAASLELDDVLGKALTLTVRAVRATAGSIFLLDTNGRVVRSILASGDRPPQIAYPLVETVLNKGFAGWVYQQRKAGIIADTTTDERWHFFPDDVIVTRSAIAAPLIRRDIVIGIVILHHLEPYAFSKRQLQLVEAIAAQAAGAIENAALYASATNERSILQAIIASARDIVIVIDTDDRLFLVNPMAQRSLGVHDQFQGRMFAEVFRESALIEFYESGKHEEQALREVRFEDGRVFDCALARIPNVGRVLSMHDVTTFKLLDALKSEFVSHVAHDLKAPLGVMQGYAWLLNDHPDLREEARAYIHQITESITRMRALIDNILDLGRIEMGIQSEFQAVAVEAVLHDSIRNMQSLARNKRIDLRAQAGEGVPWVRGSALRLGQAVTNLVGNALKFTPAGGSVVAKSAFENGQVIIRVTDSGPGIAPHLQTKLFQKFARLGQGATQKNEGHGLGLAIVKSVVDAHGGRVWVESQPGKGSTFGIALPPLDSQTASPEP
ncbi:MAG TPA: ATP-binding protein [Anaerolineales bacterium]|nr:ATP-binding protein [Anaerolineales bacterium]